MLSCYLIFLSLILGEICSFSLAHFISINTLFSLEVPNYSFQMSFLSTLGNNTSKWSLTSSCQIKCWGKPCERESLHLALFNLGNVAPSQNLPYHQERGRREIQIAKFSKVWNLFIFQLFIICSYITITYIVNPCLSSLEFFGKSGLRLGRK